MKPERFSPVLLDHFTCPLPYPKFEFNKLMQRSLVNSLCGDYGHYLKGYVSKALIVFYSYCLILKM